MKQGKTAKKRGDKGQGAAAQKWASTESYLFFFFAYQSTMSHVTSRVATGYGGICPSPPLLTKDDQDFSNQINEFPFRVFSSKCCVDISTITYFEQYCFHLELREFIVWNGKVLFILFTHIGSLL